MLQVLTARGRLFFVLKTARSTDEKLIFDELTRKDGESRPLVQAMLRYKRDTFEISPTE